MSKKTLLIIGITVVAVIIVVVVVIVLTKGPALPEEIYGLSGTITEIKNSTLKMDANLIYVDGSSRIKSRKIVVDQNTKLIKLIFPELDPRFADKPVVPEESEISFEELKTGDKIDVLSYENIRDKKKFTAKEIKVIH